MNKSTKYLLLYLKKNNVNIDTIFEKRYLKLVAFTRMLNRDLS